MTEGHLFDQRLYVISEPRERNRPDIFKDITDLT